MAAVASITLRFVPYAERGEGIPLPSDVTIPQTATGRLATRVRLELWASAMGEWIMGQPDASALRIAADLFGGDALAFVRAVVAGVAVFELDEDRKWAAVDGGA